MNDRIPCPCRPFLPLAAALTLGFAWPAHSFSQTPHADAPDAVAAPTGSGGSGPGVLSEPAEAVRLDGDLDFGFPLEGQLERRLLTLYNDGPDPVTVTNLVWPAGFSGSWTGILAGGQARHIPADFQTSATGTYGGTVAVQFDATTVTATRAASGTVLPFPGFAVTNPAGPLEVDFFTTNVLVRGVMSTALVGQVRWTNDLTGETGTAPAQPAWQAAVPLAIGTNPITIVATNQPGYGLIAADDASAATYADGWQQGDNGGFGFGEWRLSSNGVNAGHLFVTNVPFDDLDSGDEAWALWAHSGDEAHAFRALPRPLRSGDTVRVTIENPQVMTAGAVGVALENPDGESLLEFYFEAGNIDYTLRDDSGLRDSGIQGNANGLLLDMTLTGPDTYRIDTPASAVTGSLIARTDLSVVRFRAWNHNAGAGDNAFFVNHLSVTQRPPVYTTSDTVTAIRDLGEPPVITADPVGFTGEYSRAASLAVAFTGAPPFVVRWRKNGNPLPGETNATLAFDYPLLNDSGEYDAVVSNVYGAVTSALAEVIFERAMPAIVWPDPDPVVYGTPLGPQQLDAVAETDGVYEYIPEAGVVIDAGTNLLYLQFVPDDIDNWRVAEASATLVVEQAPQTIDFPNPGNQIVTNTVSLTASSDSGLPVTVSLISGPAQLAGGVLTFTDTGVVSIAATQAGNGNWLAAGVTNTFSVTPVPVTKLPAEVGLVQLNHTYDGTLKMALVFTEPEELPIEVVYDGIPINAGSYGVTATIVDDVYEGIATGTLVIAQAPQAVEFPPIPDQVATAVVPLVAYADSELEIVYTVVSGPAQVNGSLLTFTGAGEVSIAADQPGDANWLAAAPVTNSFTVILFVDSNTNGLPDEWELDNFESLEVSTGDSDQDEDQTTDLEEYIAGTDPTDEHDYFYVVREATDDPARLFSLTWPSVSNRVYDIYRSTNPLEPYLPRVLDIPADPPFNIYLDDAPSPPSDVFYQIRVRMAP